MELSTFDLLFRPRPDIPTQGVPPTQTPYYYGAIIIVSVPGHNVLL